MTVRLLVVGRHSRVDQELETVAGLPRTHPKSSFQVARCPSPDDLVETVRQQVIDHGLVDVLDLFDHGRAGRIYMGDRILFDADGTGAPVAGALSRLLTIDARVRLLGCETAARAPGRCLLQGVQRQLGPSRVVYGTIGVITAEHFDRGGYMLDKESFFLFSSTEAASGMAPAWRDRFREVQARRRDIIEHR